MNSATARARVLEFVCIFGHDGIAKLHCSTDSIGDTFMQGGNC